jgi:uncharacterized protein (TIGR03437 family)
MRLTPFLRLCSVLASIAALASPCPAQDQVQASDGGYTIATVAGSSWVGDEGPATAAILFQAEGVLADANGDLYIADAVDNRVRMVDSRGNIHTVAGTGVRGFSGDGGPAAQAQLNAPYGLALDRQGNLYVADLGNARVRRIAPDGTIATVAGGGSLPAGGENDGTAAVLLALEAPRNLAVDGAGNLYISDFEGQRVYRLAPDGSLTTAAGTGVEGTSGDGGAAIRAQLAYPAGLAVDAQGSLYIADSRNHLIRKVSRGVITSIAETATPTGLAFGQDGTLWAADPSAGEILKIPPSGPVTALPIAAGDLTFSPLGILYASTNASAAGNTVLAIAPSGMATVFAGGGDLAHGDGGPAQDARLNQPAGVAFDASGNLYIADRGNNRIRRISADGTISTVAGTASLLDAPSSVAADALGDLYVADTGNHRVLEIASDGSVTTAASKGLTSPVYAVPDSSGNVYIADDGAAPDQGEILRADSSGVATVLLSGLQEPRGLALDSQGNLYFTEAGAARVERLAPDGSVSPLAPGFWQIPRGVAVDASGNVFVADTGLQRVFKIDSSGAAFPIAGTGTAGFSGDGGAAVSAQLGYPWDIALGPNGVVAIADLDNNRVRLLTPPFPVPQPQGGGTPLAVPDAVNAASLAPGPVAPGMLLFVRHTGIAPASIGDTQVIFGTIPAHILSADVNGLLVMAPIEIAGLNSVTIQVVYQGAGIASVPVAVAASAPALFADSSDQAAANNADGTLNSAANPAARGSVIELYGTGLGISGAPVTVTIGGYNADVLYAGPVSAYPGLFQINASVPSGYLAPGDLPVVVRVAGSSSQAGVSVWVK